MQWTRTPQQLCLFHVNKNVVAYIRREWETTDSEPTGQDEEADPPLLGDEDDDETRQSLSFLNELANDPEAEPVPQITEDEVEDRRAGLYPSLEANGVC